MKTYEETDKLHNLLYYKDYDRNILVGAKICHNGVIGTITGIDRGLYKVEFDSTFRSATGRPIRQGRIMWPDRIELSELQESQLLASPNSAYSKLNNAAIARAEAEAELYYHDKQHSSSEPEFDDYEDEEQREARRAESLEYNDSASRGHQDGWFYSDED